VLVLALLAAALLAYFGPGHPGPAVKPTPTARLAGNVTEFRLSGAVQAPRLISRGANGRLWFIGQATTAAGIGRIIPGSTPPQITADFPLAPGAVPQGITSGSDGVTWFTQFSGTAATHSTAIGRIAPSGQITYFPNAGSGPEVPADANEITLGAENTPWFTAGNDIGHITADGMLHMYAGLADPASQPDAITLGPDGNLWFTEVGPTANKIGRITLAGKITEFLIPTNLSNPMGITLGPDGNLWFTELGSDKIGQITPTGVIREFPLPSPGDGPDQITVGPDNALWFTEYTGNQIGRLDPATGSVREYPIPTPSSRPIGITSGPDGALWFAENAANQIGRLMP
jgi:virginiamycin B lyase